MWNVPIPSVPYGQRPDVALAPDGAVWASIRNSDLSGGGTDAVFLRFNEDGTQQDYYPFPRLPHERWEAYDFVIDSRHNFHCLMYCDTVQLAYCKLDSSLQQVAWRVLRREPSDIRATLATDSIGNCLVTWSQNAGAAIYWAYLDTFGAWLVPPSTLRSGVQLGDTPSLLPYPGGRWAMVWGVILVGEESRGDLFLYTYGFPPSRVFDDDRGKPAETALSYPNPFNSTTTFFFALPRTSPVRLSVFNTLGQRVRQVNLGWLDVGEHRYVFEASGLPSGVYLARIEAAGKAEMRKMVLLR
ncbi:T9SS type A sorting domain-containing protein [bacterium]|nr:T9SS type A sorting domain-containing protein [bacterium]